MHRVELLAPAGSMESLMAAVSAGADAVYLGGIRFGARAFASNFSEDALIEAVRYCHLRDVKVYVTVNTLVYEHEMDSLIEYLRFLYDSNVDAVIVQDFGVFQILKTQFPDFEIHCSTQMHIHNKDGVQFMKKMGAHRVVLARETPIELIKECAQEGIEIEAFVHGALCVCYSGQCLFSSFHGGRSGNRGECAQPCRKPYQLLNLDTNQLISTSGDYLISPKDLWTLDHVEELIDAGITSFKIEGRMKRPEYVGEIVRTYRKAIDQVLSGKKYVFSKQDQENVLKLFNRKMTTGHLFHQTGYDLMNPIRPNHLGIPLGKVLKVSKGKILIELSHDLNQNDGIRILSQKEDMGLLASRIVLNGRLVNSAKANDRIELETSLKITCRVNDQVILTTDRLQCERIERELKTERKFPVSMKLSTPIGQQAVLVLSDGKHTVEVQSDEIVQKALKQPVTDEKIYAQLSKLNDSIYQLNVFEHTADKNIFFSLKTLNQLRRDAVEALNEKRIEFHRSQYPSLSTEFSSIQPVPSHLYDLKEKGQLSAFKENDVVFSSVIKDNLIYQKGHRVDEHSRSLQGKYVLHTQIGSLNSEKQGCWIADASLNVTNSYAIEFLLKCGMDGIVASVEADDEAVDSMIEAFRTRHGFTPQIGQLAYGRRELMIMKACLVNAALGNGKKTNCTLCRENHFALISERGQIYPLSQDGQCHPVIYESEIFKKDQFSQNGSFILVRFTDESSKECKEIKKNYENIF